MRVDEDTRHTESFVELYKTHPAHVRGKIEDISCLADCHPTRLLRPEIQHLVIDVVESLKPLIERLDVNGPKPTMATASKFGHEVAPYEASRSGHERQIVCTQLNYLRA
jgi:hypothetical protein